jgi:dihydrofolate reductase
MTTIVHYVAASADGFIATRDGAVDWLAPFEAADEDYGYAAFYASVDALLLGRRTYEQCLTFGAWPYQGKPSWVFASEPLADPPAGVVRAEGSPRDVYEALAAQGFRRVWLVGGSQLAAAFRAARLVSEYVVSVVPVLLGAGVPLFASPGPREPLRLRETTAYPNGVVQLRWAPVEGAG